MKGIIDRILLMVVTVGVISAQSGPRVQHGEEPPWPPANGTARFTLTPPPGYQPQSLMALCTRSSLIARAFVQAVLPARQVAKRLETDVVLRIDHVLKGSSTIQTIVVTQRGGVLGGYRELPSQYSLMQSGEEYLVFATVDKRPNMPVVTGSLRYWIIGEWVGNARVNNDTVHFNSGIPSALRQQYEGMNLTQFTSQVTDLLKTQ